MSLKARSKIWTRLSALVAALVGLAACIWLVVARAPDIDEYLAKPAPSALPVGTVSPDGRFTVNVRDDGSAEVWQVGGGRVGIVRGHGTSLVHAGFSADGSRVRTIDAGGTLRETAIAGLQIRDAAIGSESDFRNWINSRLWREGGRQLVRAAVNAERMANPLSSARNIFVANVSAPVLPQGIPPQAGTMFRDCEDCPQLTVVPAGTFLMGSPETEQGRFFDEGPVKEVKIPAPVAIGRFEITRDEYRQFAFDTGRTAIGECRIFDPQRTEFVPDANANWLSPGYSQGGKEPVVCVNWFDAAAYADWLSAKTGQTYRMLTEAEWEYAARAGSTTVYWWGDEASRDLSNFGTTECCAGVTEGADAWKWTAPVGSFPANPFGLFDMHGNVFEWVGDCADDRNIGVFLESGDPAQADCAFRGARGGSWINDESMMRSAYSNSADPLRSYQGLGFRVARELRE